LIYTGINGELDDLEVGKVKKYCAALLAYLSSTKKAYLDIVTDTNQFTDEAETLLKEAIVECKSSFNVE
jgi:F-type H+/Na+-transporting ATPase subunit alpha